MEDLMRPIMIIAFISSIIFVPIMADITASNEVENSNQTVIIEETQVQEKDEYYVFETENKEEIIDFINNTDYEIIDITEKSEKYVILYSKS